MWPFQPKPQPQKLARPFNPSCEIVIFYVGENQFRITGKWIDTKTEAEFVIECDPMKLSLAQLFVLVEETRAIGEAGGMMVEP